MFGKPNLKPAFWGPIFEAMFDHRSASSPRNYKQNYGLEQGHQSHCIPVRLYNKIHPLPAHEPGTAFQQLFWLLSERASKAFLSVLFGPPLQLYLHGSYQSAFKMKFEGQNYYDYMNVNADRTRKNVFKAQLNGCILLYQD